MKSKLLLVALISLASRSLKAQDLKASAIPALVKEALTKKYPEAGKVNWEKEKVNYEANWGGRSGEDNSAMFTPAGTFIEIVKAIPVTDLPKSIAPYIKAHYKGAKIKEGAK